MLLLRSVTDTLPQSTLSTSSSSSPSSTSSNPSSSAIADDGIEHTITDRHYYSDGPQSAVMAGFDHHHDHFNGNHGFIPGSNQTWHSLPAGNDPMPFDSMAHPSNMFPTNPTPQYHHQQTHSATDYASQDSQWEHRPSFTSDHHSGLCSPYNTEPTIKSEENFNTQPLDAVDQQEEPEKPATETQATLASATSPRSETGWMSASSSDHTEKASQLTFKPDHVPFFVDNPPRLRPDGVRKKNARFEIPEERRVDTIDSFIKAADPKNEPLLKELKQQKRLLRNRQAALDSRCRKKEHTQKLEEERKVLLHQLDSVSEENNQLRQQEGMWLQERASWSAEVNRLRLENEEMVQAHTQETARLRKQNNILVDDARRASVPMSLNPSSTGYSSTFSEFDHLSMNDSPTWDEFSLVNHGMPEGEATHARTTPLAQARHDRVEKEEEKPAGSGLLLMLLLCGAWVASKGSSEAGGMPPIPDDVRAAAPTVLDNIYKDAGLTSQASNVNSMAVIKAPAASHQPILHHEFNQHNNPFAYGHMTAPTHQQQRDEAFSLTPSQYNALTTDDTFFTPAPSPHPINKPGRSLHETLRLNRKGSASEAYTRSLLWDEVPANVVRDFARMMGERSAHNHEPMN